MEESDSSQATPILAATEGQKVPDANTVTLVQQLLTTLEQQSVGPSQGNHQ